MDNTATSNSLGGHNDIRHSSNRVHLQAKKPQRSQTLMRTAVKSPGHNHAQRTTSNEHTGPIKSRSAEISQPDIRVGHSTERRLTSEERARLIRSTQNPKSDLIGRFSSQNSKPKSIEGVSNPYANKVVDNQFFVPNSAPSRLPKVNPSGSRLDSLKQAAPANDSVYVPVRHPVQEQVFEDAYNDPYPEAQELETIETASQAANYNTIQKFHRENNNVISEDNAVMAAPETIPENYGQGYESFEQINNDLPNGTAAYQPPLINHKKKRSWLFKSSMASIAGLACLIIVALGGLVYHEMGSVDAYIASKKAGFSVVFPAYKPTGYTIANIATSRGAIQTNYHNAGGHKYSITERLSSWNSSQLLSHYVFGIAQQNYETVNTRGMTVYLYGKNNATWINHGIWYLIQANSGLSTKQLLQLASSS